MQSGKLLTRGTISAGAARKSGKKGHILQYHRNAKHFARSVAHDELAYFEESTANYREFMELVQKYVDEETTRAIREIEKEVGRERRKNKKSK